jgi:hypothetical protein
MSQCELCGRDEIAKQKRGVCISETPLPPFFFRMCPFGDINFPFAVRTRTTLSCLQAALSMIRPPEIHI